MAMTQQRFLVVLVALAVIAVSGANDAYLVEFDVQLTNDPLHQYARTNSLGISLGAVPQNSEKQGKFVMEVHPEWAPLGAARFKEMIEDDFFKGVRFFRVISGFMAQFGIHGNPEIAASWRNKKIKDDPVIESNKRYTVSFATSGPNSRTTQLFINFVDNSGLDGSGFAPFAKVISGTEVVDQIVSKHGETPDQGKVQSEGNRYLKRSFPALSYIRSARIVNPELDTEL